jgi:hypothetical protein
MAVKGKSLREKGEMNLHPKKRGDEKNFTASFQFRIAFLRYLG